MAQTDRMSFADDTVLAQICAGRFDDPFAILGPHKKGRIRTVTCYDPGAQTMSALSAGKLSPLAQVSGHPGLFHGAVSGTKPYVLVGLKGKVEWQVEDA